ncbi:leucine-rich repeat-containing protein [Anaeramoeba ignava]|uniref:non-specific serine/threonine protein kinase n=1 Tax=Anaeramoeba ignava TaxID=1746090 RepID=A0A9Q0LQ41_ANAIG|nr:leucine-rich repeat-containing protein [Anaeramoeba ignava]
MRKIIIIFFILFLLTKSSPNDSFQILTDFYNNLNGNNWIHNDKWLNSSICFCNWFGISCNDCDLNTCDNCSVIEINLRANNLVGDIHENIGYLENLTELSLDENEIYSIPNSIENLTNLKNLSLYSNLITVLPDSIGNLNNLENLYLFSNNIQEIPESCGNLTNLKIFDIDDNQLQSLPDSIGNMSSLEILDPSWNSITHIPDSIGNLMNLRSLDICYNQFTHLPDSIGNLSNLQFLWVSVNNITTLPETIGKLTNLSLLSCAITGLEYLPDSIGNLTNLIDFDLTTNNLKQLPESFKNLTNLQNLEIGNNQLEMDSLLIISSLPSLVTLDISFNNISGELPNFNSSSIMKSLLMQYNFLTSITESLFFTTLGIVDMSHNQLSSTFEDILKHIPVEKLTSLKIQNSNLSGILKTFTLQEPRNLAYINLADNPSLEGTFPYFRYSGVLEEIILSNTSITGSIPEAWSNHKALQLLNVSATKASGSSLPSFLTKSGDKWSKIEQGDSNMVCPQIIGKNNPNLIAIIDFSYDNFRECVCENGYYRGSQGSCVKCSYGCDCYQNTEIPCFPSPNVDNPLSINICPSISSENYPCTLLIPGLALGQSTSFECKEGYTNRLCSECANNGNEIYYLSKPQCKKCTLAFKIIQPFVFVGLVVGLIIVLYKMDGKNTVLLQIVFTFFQISEILCTDSIKLPNSILLFFSYLSQLLNFSFSFLRCFNSDLRYPQFFVIRMTLPLMAILIGVIFYYIGLAILKYKGKDKEEPPKNLEISLMENQAKINSEDEIQINPKKNQDQSLENIDLNEKSNNTNNSEKNSDNSSNEDANQNESNNENINGDNKSTTNSKTSEVKFSPKEKLKYKSISIVLFLLNVVYFTVSSTILQVFGCTLTDNSNNNKYLNSVPYYRCDSGNQAYQRILGTAIFLFIVYLIGIPILLSLIIYKFKRNEQKREIIIGFLYLQFTKKYYWWFIMDIVRKLTITLIQAVIPFYSDNITVFMYIVLQASIFLQHVFKPYAKTSNNHTCLLSFYSLLISYLAGILLKLMNRSEYKTTKNAISVALMIKVILVNIAFVFVFVYSKKTQIIQKFRKWRNKKNN